MGARTLDAAEVDTSFLGETPRQWRGEDAVGAMMGAMTVGAPPLIPSA
jgi:hypothetical protein